MPLRSKKGRGRRSLAAVLAAMIATGGALVGVSPSIPAAAAPTDSVTITPNPATAGGQFQGWGNSLVWFANATGGYPDELRNELYQKVFGADGLNMNVARYNIGGGRASDVGNYFRYGAAVDGYWRADTSTDADSLYGIATTNYADRLKMAAAWDPNNPDHFDWSKDATQRWWLGKLAQERKDLVLEGFVNSPPYFMTNSGYTSGNTPSSAEQVLTSNDVPAKFAGYIKQVAQHLEQSYGVKFQTLTPFNEPCTGYWGTTSGREADGVTPKKPTGANKTQEGAQICPGSGAGQQQNLIKLLAEELAKPGTTTKAVISSNDETNPANFNAAWEKYDAATRANVGQINVHTYWDGGARQARDSSRGGEKTLWMSETGGDFVNAGFDPLSMNGGLGLAKKITDDLRQLQPEAYVLWQEVEDYYNMQQASPRGENLNWGSIFIDFDCSYVDASGNALSTKEGSIGFKSLRRVADAKTDGKAISEVPNCGIVTNQKFNTMRNFMHFIKQGDHLIQSDNSEATAALRGSGSGLNVVYTNSSSSDRSVTIDLKDFATISAGASATPYVTTQAPAVNDLSTALVKGAPVKVDAASKTVTLTVPARSVTTFEVDGVSGVSDTAPSFVDGQTYQLIGQQSAKPLTNGGSNGLTITSDAGTAEAVKPQLWTVHEVDLGGHIAGRQAFVLESAAGGYAVFDSAGSAVRSYASLAEAKADPAARWYPISEDGKSWVLANGFDGKILDVGGSATADNSKVGWWINTNGANQRWIAHQVSAAPSAAPVAVKTQVGTAPTLPEIIVPVYSWGKGAATAVTWELPADSAWGKTGTVKVPGSATDIYGNKVADVVAVVEVGPITSVDPTSVKVVTGTRAADLAALLPATVDAQVGGGASRFPVAVTWQTDSVTDAQLASPTTLRVTGTVAGSVTGGDDVTATLYVLVVEATGTKKLDVGCSATATYTEPKYSVSNTCNGNRTDKAWSNWKDSPKRDSDTLTYQLSGAPLLANATIYFYKDGSSFSFPSSIQAEYQAPGSSEWVKAGDPVAVPESATAPVVEVPMKGLTASAVRFVLTARPNTHMIVSEVEFYRPDAGPVSVADLARLTVNGTDVADFDSQKLSYEVPVVGSRAEVSAVALDRDAKVRTSREGSVFTIVVTATDGTTKTYSVTVDQTVAVTGASVTGSGATGTALTASAVTDPTDAKATYQWLSDGQPIDGATSAAFTPGIALIGKGITVRVTATADGFHDGTQTSDPVIVTDGRSDSGVTIAPDRQHSVLGSKITLTATVSPSDAKGTVEFSDGGSVIGSSPVTAGSATFSTTDLGAGTHALTARFLPSDTEALRASTSPATQVSVYDGALASITLSKASVKQGEKVSITGSGFAPGEIVSLTLHSTPVELGNATADDKGGFTREVTIGTSVEATSHTIAAVGLSSSLKATAELAVTPRGDNGGNNGGTDNGGGNNGGGNNGGTDNGGGKPAQPGRPGLPNTGVVGSALSGIAAAVLLSGIGIAAWTRRSRKA